MNTKSKVLFGMVVTACLSLSAAEAAGVKWQNVISCEDSGGHRYDVKTTYDRGLLPNENKHYIIKGQGALVTIGSPNDQIPSLSDLQTGLDLEMSRTNNFLQFWVQVTAGEGRTILRRYENNKAELFQYVFKAVPLSTGGGANAGGEWVRTELTCKPQ